MRYSFKALLLQLLLLAELGELEHEVIVRFGRFGVRGFG